MLPLQGPANDIAALARVLCDAERGNFEVQEFLDKPHYEIMHDIAHALSNAVFGDFFLVYYSGHGKLDRNGRLCLATADTDTRQSALLATSIRSNHLYDLVDDSNCDQVVLLLDCCYSGAVGVGLRGDVNSALQIVNEARGSYTITATTDMQSAREMALGPDGVVMGRFTAALVDGIVSGAADRQSKGKILLSDLRQYLGRVEIGSDPQFFDRRASGDPLISLSPATKAPLLDPEVLADLDAEQWHRRHGAVSALSSVLRIGDAAARAAAMAALERRLGQERDFTVRAELEAALGPESINTPDVVRRATSPTMNAPTMADVSEAHSLAVLRYKRDADQGHTDAQYKLAHCYKNGVGVPQSDEDAVRFYKLAADQDHADAQVELGNRYSNGQGVPQSDAEAARLFKLAADRGNAQAEANLGFFYETGRGVPQSDDEAVRLYKLAADRGNAQAQTDLGFLYSNGRGVPQSYAEAARLYKLAADQGYAPAQAILGVAHALGRGVPRSDAEAARLYKLAADQGNAPAQANLGLLYEFGRGSPMTRRPASTSSQPTRETRWLKPVSVSSTRPAAVCRSPMTRRPAATSSQPTRETRWLKPVSASST